MAKQPSSLTWKVICFTGMMSMLLNVSWGQALVRRHARRAALPRWEQLPSTFFADAFQEALRGNRPGDQANLPPRSTTPAPHESTSQSDTEPANPTSSPSESSSDNSGAGADASGMAWPDVIAAAVLENEVKRLQQELDRSVVSLGKFRAADYKLVEQQLWLLATYMAVIAEYDGEIRWQSSARSMSWQFAKAARQTAEPSAESFAAAQQCRDALRDLVRGTPPANSAQEPLPTDWSQLARRDMLMRRLNIASEERLPAGSSASPLAVDDLQHEAQVVRLIAKLLSQPGMEDGEDADYLKLCDELSTAARTILDGLPTSDTAAVSRGTGDVKKSCAACHETYRG